MSLAEKAALRRDLLARRDLIPGRESRSEAIAARLRTLVEYRIATVLSAYVGVGGEVATAGIIESIFQRGLPVAVPWVDGDHLRLTAVTSLDQLEAAPFGLLEPPPALKESTASRVDPAGVHLYLVPGLAFDRQGGRLGYGRGYYDRLLGEAGPGPLRIALGFEAQLVNRVPMTGRDQPMDLVVTEAAVYRVSARTASAVR